MTISIVERNAGSRYFETTITMSRQVPGPDQALLTRSVKLSASCNHFTEASVRQAFMNTVADYERKGYTIGG